MKKQIEITRHGKRKMACRIVCNHIDGRRGIREVVGHSRNGGC